MQLAGARDIFLSHGHLDHVSGLPFVLSQRSFHQGEETRVFCPPGIAGPLADYVRAAERLEGGSYRWRLLPMAPGDRAAVGRGMTVEAFEVPHVVPALGFHLLGTRRRLRPDLAGRDREELVALRAAGESLEERTEEPWLTYCGDSSAAVFDADPRVLTSRVLVVECTFVTPELREKGVRYGHMHFADLEANAHRLQNDAIVLVHLSRRHRPADLRARIDAELPQLAPRIHVLGESRDRGR